MEMSIDYVDQKVDFYNLKISEEKIISEMEISKNVIFNIITDTNSILNIPNVDPIDIKRKKEEELE